MKIDELINAVLAKRNEVARVSKEYPRLAVYVTPEYYHEMMYEILGRVSYPAYEAFSSTLAGFPLYIAREPSVPRNNHRHPPFVVVALSL